MFPGVGGEKVRKMRGFLICPGCGLKRPGPAPRTLTHSCHACFEAKARALGVK